MLVYRVIFSTGLPNFSTKKKIAIQPITAAVPVNLVNIKKVCDWLIGGFLFGTEIGEGQLQKPPCMILMNALALYYFKSLFS